MNTESNSIQPFQYGEQPIRIIMIEGLPWWIATDLCAALGLEYVSQAIRPISEANKGVFSVHTPGGPQSMLIVNEPGMYALIFKSKKKEAQVFQEWIYNDVLPSLARTGSYTKPGSLPPPRDLPTLVELHRDQLSYLLSQGVPPATACRSADQLMSLCKKLPGIAPDEAEQEPSQRDLDRQRLLDMMQRDVWYSTEDLAALLPPRHHLCVGSKEARGSRIGKLLKDALDQLRLEKHPNSRHAIYRLPAVVEFPEAGVAES